MVWQIEFLWERSQTFEHTTYQEVRHGLKIDGNQCQKGDGGTPTLELGYWNIFRSVVCVFFWPGSLLIQNAP